jgi:predicted RNase H-like HicB family nuclease
MHAIVLYFFVITLLLNPRLDVKESAVANLDRLDLTLVGSQIVLVLYLIYVSFQKIAEQWAQAKTQVKAEQLAQQALKHHIAAEALVSGKPEEILQMQQHFDQLRHHFSVDVATRVTVFHHARHDLRKVAVKLDKKTEAFNNPIVIEELDDDGGSDN